MSVSNRNLVYILTALAIISYIFGIATGFIANKYLDDQEMKQLPNTMTYSEMQQSLAESEASPIYSLAFEKHHDYSNITLSNYDARNYCLIIYDENGNELVHSWLADVFIATDSSLEDSYFIPLDKGSCILKTSEDLFVSQLSAELFRDLSEDQIDFILSYLFRNV